MDILLVEDSPEVSLITVEYLQELDHQVVAVADAEEALQQLKSAAFDAVMTDVSLPGMSGIELAAEVARQFPTMPIVIASGYGSLNLEVPLAATPGKLLVLTKPYDLTSLENVLNEVKGYMAK